MQSIGERLEEARKRKGISIREAAEATKIRSDYLHKFEGNQFDLNLPEIYVRGFLRNYAYYLKLPGEKIVNDYQALGVAESRAGRGSNREIYGRMEASAAAAPKAPAAEETRAAAGVPAAEESHRAGVAPIRPVSPGSSIAGLDRVLLIKSGTLIAGGVLALALVVWAIVALVSGGDGKSGEPVSAVRSADALTIAISKPVRLRIIRQADSAELLNRDVPAGFRQDIPNVPVFVSASAMEAVTIEFKGRTYGTGQTGQSRVSIDFTKQQ